jgi:hypothetical protein
MKLEFFSLEQKIIVEVYFLFENIRCLNHTFVGSIFNHIYARKEYIAQTKIRNEIVQSCVF